VLIFSALNGNLCPCFEIKEAKRYIDNYKKVNGINGGFAPISYTPKTIPGIYVLPVNDEGRDLGNGWGGAEKSFVDLLDIHAAGGRLEPLASYARSRFVLFLGGK